MQGHQCCSFQFCAISVFFPKLIDLALVLVTDKEPAPDKNLKDDQSRYLQRLTIRPSFVSSDKNMVFVKEFDYDIELDIIEMVRIVKKCRMIMISTGLSHLSIFGCSSFTISIMLFIILISSLYV